MVALQLVPIILSLVVLGAHFLRGGHVVLVAAILVVIGALFVRRPWAARTAQTTLGLGALVWLQTLFQLATTRMQAGEPVKRLVIILSSVTAVTLLSALVFQSATLRRRYGLGQRGGSRDA